MKQPYTLHIYNTLTGQYEDVPVTEEIYHTYRRTGWNIADNDSSFAAHQTPFSSLIGGEDGTYENFHEFISDTDDPRLRIDEAEIRRTLRRALASITPEESRLLAAFFGSTPDLVEEMI